MCDEERNIWIIELMSYSQPQNIKKPRCETEFQRSAAHKMPFQRLAYRRLQRFERIMQFHGKMPPGEQDAVAHPSAKVRRLKAGVAEQAELLFLRRRRFRKTPKFRHLVVMQHTAPHSDGRAEKVQTYFEAIKVVGRGVESLDAGKDDIHKLAQLIIVPF